MRTLTGSRFGHCITFDTGNSVGEITGQSSAINAVAIRQQRPLRAATGSDDHTVVLHHGAPFKFHALLRHHANFVLAVAFSPDGAHLVTAGADRRLVLLDGLDGSLRADVGRAADAHAGSVLAVAWAPDSCRFASASADRTVRLWDVAASSSPALLRSWTLGPEGSVPDHQVGAVWLPRPASTDTDADADGGELVVALSLSGALTYLSPAADSPVRVVGGHKKPISALALATTATTATLFSGSTDGTVCSWDLACSTPQVVQGPGHTGVIAGLVACLQPGHGAEADAGAEVVVTSVGWDDQLRIIRRGQFADAAHAATESQPKGVALLGPATMAVLTATELRICFVATQAPQLLARHRLAFTPTALAACPATGAIAVAGQDRSIRIYSYSAASPATITAAAPVTLSRAFATALAYSPDGSLFAAGDSTGLVSLYSTGDGGYTKKTDRWAFHRARVEQIAWNRRGTHVATVSLDTDLRIYSVARPGVNAKELHAHMGGGTAVCWLPRADEESETLVSAGADGAIKRWAVVLP